MSGISRYPNTALVEIIPLKVIIELRNGEIATARQKKTGEAALVAGKLLISPSSSYFNNDASILALSGRDVAAVALIFRGLHPDLTTEQITKSFCLMFGLSPDDLGEAILENDPHGFSDGIARLTISR